jgi:hypothetical protein
MPTLYRSKRLVFTRLILVHKIVDATPATDYACRHPATHRPTTLIPDRGPPNSKLQTLLLSPTPCPLNPALRPGNVDEPCQKQH